MHHATDVGQCAFGRANRSASRSHQLYRFRASNIVGEHGHWFYFLVKRNVPVTNAVIRDAFEYRQRDLCSGLVGVLSQKVGTPKCEEERL